MLLFLFNGMGSHTNTTGLLATNHRNFCPTRLQIEYFKSNSTVPDFSSNNSRNSDSKTDIPISVPDYVASERPEAKKQLPRSLNHFVMDLFLNNFFVFGSTRLVFLSLGLFWHYYQSSGYSCPIFSYMTYCFSLNKLFISHRYNIFNFGTTSCLILSSYIRYVRSILASSTGKMAVVEKK